ncbi:MAG: MFS transporter [Flavobacteriia bacterium]|nr:MAG: MFS transporter [Flavobacteriia bacterium]
METNNTQPKWKSILQEIAQPFIDLTKTSKAMLGINISYLVEGLTYFGIIGLLALFYNNYVGLDDIHAGWMVGFLTAGITISMLVLGATVDLVGIRKSLLIALFFILIGRVVLTASPELGQSGLWNSAQIISLLGILGIVIGYGIYQPAAYAAVKKLNTKKNAAMGYAMLYALMNLGGFLPGIISPPVRKAYGISGVFWVFSGITVIGILAIAIFVTKKAIANAQAAVKLEDGDDVEDEDELAAMSTKEKLKYYLKNFPLKDLRFLFFIFILIPVQTLFAHNWLTLPQYTSRAFEGFVGENFEFFVNLNPILIFVLTPVVTALTLKQGTYKMMIVGTLIMALPTFFLAFGPNFYTLMAYLILMTVGEALWQPRFLQWVADIAPKGMTGIYMGIGQFPWFLTKIITALYSGWFLQKYIPADVPADQLNSERMWLIYGLIAITSFVGLVLARKWMLKGFKEQ